MSSGRYLTWENFRSTIIVRGEQRVHEVCQHPLVQIFGDGVAGELGLLVQVPESTTVPLELCSLEAIRVRVLQLSGKHLLEVRSRDLNLDRQFYHFCTAVSERILTDGAQAVIAVAAEIDSFNDLLREGAVLSIERQVGLLGELLFLQLLLERGGAAAIHAWIGPFKEPHDFLIVDREFEVKTTLGGRRLHTINGASQLLPSPGKTLFVTSIMLGPAGAGLGFSLPEVVHQVEGKLPQGEFLNRFVAALKSSSYKSTDEGHYTKKYVFRRPMAIVPVDLACPSLTPMELQMALGGRASRIEDLHYEVNLEGLAHDKGTDFFERVLGPASKGKK